MAVYTVKSGDTLSSIAQKLGISSWQTLYSNNKSVIGSNHNLIYPGQKLNYGDTSTGGTSSTSTADTSASAQAKAAAEAQPGNFADVLSFQQYFNPELAQGSAEQVYANYYAPIVQQAQNELESSYAGRGLTRSGLRSQGVSDLYRQYGQEQQAGIESDVLQQQANAREDYERMRDLYESSSGGYTPESTKYEAYQVAKPTTSAGTYGSTYLDWLNRALQV